MKQGVVKFLQQAGRNAGDGLLGLVYPRTCYGCEELLGEQPGWLCADCTGQLHPITRPFCEVCCQPFWGDLAEGFQCSNCADRDLRFDFARAAYQSRDLARVLVHRFKYKGQFFLARLLGEMLDQALEDPRIAEVAESGEWVLVPVPLHARRQREREFNQAEELSREVAHRRGLKSVNALRRTRYTRRQAMLDRVERLTNLRGAFAISPKTRESKAIVGKRVLLVDDVLTTGATASECARTLSGGGALKVVVITVVRG